MSRLRPAFQGALCLGAALAVVGGAAIGILHIVDPDIPLLKQIESGYRHIIFGFLFLTLFAVAATLLDALAPARGTGAEPPPASAGAAGGPPAVADGRAAPAEVRPAAAAPAALESLYHEMKTFIDLEMWELAFEKAGAILKGYPGSREADLVGRNINELRWKAEPKFVGQGKPLSADQQKELREKGLAQMYQHVRTYMDLDMWELARQKAIAIMKNFPDSAEAAELMKVYETIERRARETVGTGKSQN